MATQRERTIVIIQARMDSTRLPGKLFLPVPTDGAMSDYWPAGQPLLLFLMERLNRLVDSGLVDQLVVATTSRLCDRRIRTTMRDWGYDCLSEAQLPVSDVLGRYVHAADKFGADTIVRITADCPLLWPTVVVGAICFYEWHRALGTQYVYTSRDWPDGMDVEVFSSDILRVADEHANDPAEREHVTLWMRRSPMMAQARNEFPCPARWSDLRVTLDTPADYAVICNVLRRLGSDCTLADIVQLWQDEPELFEPNRELAEQRAVALCQV